MRAERHVFHCWHVSRESWRSCTRVSMCTTAPMWFAAC